MGDQDRTAGKAVKAAQRRRDVGRTRDHRLGNPVNLGRLGRDAAAGIDERVENLALHPAAVHQPQRGDLHDLIALLRQKASRLGVEDDIGKVIQTRLGQRGRGGFEEQVKVIDDPAQQRFGPARGHARLTQGQADRGPPPAALFGPAFRRVAGQNRPARGVVAGPLQRFGQPAFQRTKAKGRAGPGQLDHRARPVLNHRDREVAGGVFIGQTRGQTGEQGEDLKPVAAQEKPAALSHDGKPRRFHPGADAVEKIGTARHGHRPPARAGGIVAPAKLVDGARERSHILDQGCIERGAFLPILARHDADHGLKAGGGAADAVEDFIQQPFAPGMGVHVGGDVAQRQHIAGAAFARLLHQTHPAREEVRAVQRGHHQVGHRVGIARGQKPVIGMAQRRLAQIGKDRPVQPDLGIRAQKAGGLTVVEHHLVPPRTQQHPHRHIGQERLKPRLFFRQPPGFAFHRLGQRATGDGQVFRHRPGGGGEVPKIAGGRKVQRPGAFGMGLRAKPRRNPPDGAGNVFVEKVPDPGD